MWFENLLLNVFSVGIASFIIIILYFKWKYNYWKNLGVEYMEPSIPFGNSYDILTRKISFGENAENSYRYYRSKKSIHGGSYFFVTPTYFPADLDLIKRIMQVDFSHFTDHSCVIDEVGDPLSAHLFAIGGEKWKKLRTKLTPTFSSGKIKNMFPIMMEISKKLIEVFEKEYRDNGVIEAKEITSRFTTDVIANCAFGLECNSLDDPNTEFRIYGKRVFQLTVLELIATLLSIVLPNVARFLKLRLIPKVAEEFFMATVRNTMEYREENNVRRNDLFQLLLDMKSNDGKESDTTLTFNEIAAQSFIFYLGGFETSSTLMCFALLELGLNEEIQTMLRSDINNTLAEHNNEFTYEAMNDMKYLDMVINETLRKHPPFPAIPRICTKDYHVPDTNVVLRKGDSMLIPIRGIHRDPEYYPDPEKFDPNRFNEENRGKRHPYAFIPFGEGPRICIGLRFGLMQAKIGLATIIRNFRIKLNKRTALPVKLEPVSLVSVVVGGVWLDVEKITP